MGLGFGLGIGLQAKPKDYAELIRARESAKQKAIAAKAAKDADKAQKLYEKWYFRNISNSYLPFQQEDANKYVQELIDAFETEAEKDTPNMTTLNTVVATTEAKLQQLVTQKKTADKFFQNPNSSGYGTEEFQAIYSEPDKNNVYNIIKEKGVGIAYDPKTNIIQFRTVGEYDKNNVTSQLRDYFDTYRDKLFDPKNIKAEIQVADTKYRYTGVAAEAKDAWLNSARFNPGSIRDFEFKYKSTKKVLPDFTDPKVQQEYAEYLSDRYDAEIEPLVERAGGNKRAVTNISTAEKEKRAEYSITGGQVYNAGSDTKKDEYETFGEFGGKNVTVTTDIPKGTFDLNNLVLFAKLGEQVTYSKLAVYPVKPDNVLALKSSYGEGYPRKLALGVYAMTSGNQSLVITNPSTRHSAVQYMVKDEKSNLEILEKKLQQAVDEYNSMSDAGKKEVWSKRTTYPNIIEALEAYKKEGMD